MAAGMIVLGGIELGIKAAQIWMDYNAELLALQQARAAEGKTVSAEDIAAALARTHAKLDANHAKLQAAQAAWEASKA